MITFSSVLWHCWLGDRKGIQPVKELGVGLLLVMIWLELCTTYSSSSPVVNTTSIILCFNNHWRTQVHLENGRLKRSERVLGDVQQANGFQQPSQAAQHEEMVRYSTIYIPKIIKLAAFSWSYLVLWDCWWRNHRKGIQACKRTLLQQLSKVLLWRIQPSWTIPRENEPFQQKLKAAWNSGSSNY